MQINMRLILKMPCMLPNTVRSAKSKLKKGTPLTAAKRVPPCEGFHPPVMMRVPPRKALHPRCGTCSFRKVSARPLRYVFPSKSLAFPLRRVFFSKNFCTPVTVRVPPRKALHSRYGACSFRKVSARPLRCAFPSKRSCAPVTAWESARRRPIPRW